MDRGIYLNESLDYMIQLYLNTKDKVVNHDPLLNVCKFLVGIYGETDVVNPYLTKNMKIFMDNLMVFGLPKESVMEFLTNLNDFYRSVIVSKSVEQTDCLQNIYLALIDMLENKANKQIIFEAELHFFDTLIYSKSTNDSLLKLYNLYRNQDSNIIGEYWENLKSKIVQPVNVVNPVEESKPLLSPQIYLSLGLDYAEILKMSNDQIKSLNEEIMKDMSSNESGGRNIETPAKEGKVLVKSFTSGNAVIDSILLIGFIATQILMGLVIILEFMKE